MSVLPECFAHFNIKFRNFSHLSYNAIRSVVSLYFFYASYIFPSNFCTSNSQRIILLILFLFCYFLFFFYVLYILSKWDKVIFPFSCITIRLSKNKSNSLFYFSYYSSQFSPFFGVTVLYKPFTCVFIFTINLLRFFISFILLWTEDLNNIKKNNVDHINKWMHFNFNTIYLIHYGQCYILSHFV